MAPFFYDLCKDKMAWFMSKIFLSDCKIKTT